MTEFQLLNTTDFVTTLEKESIIQFLMGNLDDYCDSHENVSRSIEYALSKFPHQGGFVLLARWNAQVGASVVNRTNFEGYFAENILVYLAVAKFERGKGIAKELLKQTKLFAKGDILFRMKAGGNGDLCKASGFEESATEYLFRREH